MFNIKFNTYDKDTPISTGKTNPIRLHKGKSHLTLTVTLWFGLLLSLIPGFIFSQNWSLVWQDEFTNGISSDWVFETGNGYSGWGNNELQYYRRENATVENGNLVITAKRESFGGYNYTSARMKTQGRKSFRYGKIEARIALPLGQGLWPAFWMLGNNISSVGWPACGEIDIMEHINNEATTYGTIHWQDHNGNKAEYGGSTGVNVSAYHVYSIEWDQNYIRWFVDGNQFHIVDISNGINGTSEFHNEHFLLLNMAVGGNWPGFSIDNSKLPARMYVDYVRVYQDNGTGGGGGPTLVIEAENYSNMFGVQKENCSEGGQNVGYIDTGDWMAYQQISFPTSGNYLIQYRVASKVNGARLSADLNAGNTVLGQVSIPNTGGWQNWTTVSHTVNVTAGTHSFGLYAVSGGWNINWIKISKSQQNARLSDTEATSNTGIMKDIKDINLATIYPNPFVNAVQFKFGEKNATIAIFDALGHTIIASRTIESGESIDLSNLTKGLYLVTIEKGGVKETKRLIKQ
ncbi:carbohydrate-binding protein [Fulvivirga sp. M361]|uniref:carbohydrate-binding protein n=1 Tax=Fulvivirga sp. M361 TaxID=2594266 RepID=UPI00117A9FA7|nr:carbohydrate-binding protein [Fulvivirga sp. M361]TRX45872.1 carbohydrate-binding protein [Fulvivirga sp. M361]